MYLMADMTSTPLLSMFQLPFVTYMDSLVSLLKVYSMSVLISGPIELGVEIIHLRYKRHL